jgi:hypothetical protein
MALFFECMLPCARKVLDTADIVREAIFQQLVGFVGRRHARLHAIYMLFTVEVLSVAANQCHQISPIFELRQRDVAAFFVPHCPVLSLLKAELFNGLRFRNRPSSHDHGPIDNVARDYEVVVLLMPMPNCDYISIPPRDRYASVSLPNCVATYLSVVT